jgi:predicted nucleic acid-binding protein
VAERPAVNASPLIFLARAALLELLRDVAGQEIIVPAPVADEIRRRGPDDVTVRAMQHADWLVVVEPPPIPPLISAWDLGAGESSVLAWAHAHPGAEAILDDLAGRRCAAVLGIPVRGTLGLILIAKQRGYVPAARPVLERLRKSGMYLSDAVLDRALALVGE